MFLVFFLTHALFNVKSSMFFIMVNVTIPLTVTQNLPSGRAGKYVKFQKKKEVTPSEPSFQIFTLKTHRNITLNASLYLFKCTDNVLMFN